MRGVHTGSVSAFGTVSLLCIKSINHILDAVLLGTYFCAWPLVLTMVDNWSVCYSTTYHWICTDVLLTSSSVFIVACVFKLQRSSVFVLFMAQYCGLVWRRLASGHLPTIAFGIFCFNITQMQFQCHYWRDSGRMIWEGLYHTTPKSFMWNIAVRASQSLPLSARAFSAAAKGKTNTTLRFLVVDG